jgi:Flp pilus assembly protein protease CpaA
MNDDPFFFSLKSWVVLGLAILIAGGDLWHYRISNRSVVLTILIGLAWNASSHQWTGAMLGLLGVLVGFALLLPFYAIGGLTAGDVKWLAALGAWYGPRGIVGLFVLSSILLGVFCVVWIVARGLSPLECVRAGGSIRGFRGAKTQGNTGIDEAYSSQDRRLFLIPYAVPVALGVLMIESYRAMHN